MNDSCFICNKHKGHLQTDGVVIYENEYVYVGHIDNQGKPSYLGHLMIDLKRHVPTLAEMTPDEAKSFGVMVSRVSKALKETESAEHIYAVVAGNAVPHLHMHLVARYPHTPEEYWGPFAVQEAPNAKMGNPNDVTELCKRIKSYLEMTPYE
ncbi:HIT family protein [Bacillus sp. 31A1R]|uniref:HIT family protein n=1 Tax=Robertmurraya mangrovi TaxID=3098077 RepID=A0ABU5J103_9BACI|nr:HIT family protein [Bacillus sp. 31A1R]MDZ5473100.1 HIT family protein [Bacillus sp. 31A1R]